MTEQNLGGLARPAKEENARALCARRGLYPAGTHLVTGSCPHWRAERLFSRESTFALGEMREKLLQWHGIQNPRDHQSR